MTQQRIAHRLFLLTAFAFFLLTNTMAFAQTPSPPSTIRPVESGFSLTADTEKVRPRPDLGPGLGIVIKSSPTAPPSTLSELEKKAEKEVMREDLWQSQKLSLALGILGFGAILLLLQMYAMLTKGQYWDQWSYRLFGLSIIVIAGIFLIIVGYNQEQIAGVMGLLGTALGYLLGKSDVGNPVKTDSPPQKNP